MLNGPPPTAGRPLWVDSLEKVAPRLACGKVLALASREARSMMGQLENGQERLFYSFYLKITSPPLTFCAALIGVSI